jgi:hypothetical protein
MDIRPSETPKPQEDVLLTSEGAGASEISMPTPFVAEVGIPKVAQITPTDHMVSNPMSAIGQETVARAFSAELVSPQAGDANDQDLRPQPVVKVLSPLGVEYVFMTVALFTMAAGLGSALITLVNGKSSFSVLAYPASLLVVSVPVFALLFLRLKKIELKDSAQRLDASKRRSTQFIQIVNFLICFFTLIGLVGIVISKLGGNYKSSLVKVFLDVLVIEVIAGGILVYYWHDEHKKR